MASLHVGDRNAFVMSCRSDADPDKGGVIVTDHVRLFPLSDTIRWKYRVHEQILPSLEEVGITPKWTNITIRHTGYANAEVKERKRQRDWEILHQELASRPND